MKRIVVVLILAASSTRAGEGFQAIYLRETLRKGSDHLVKLGPDLAVRARVDLRGYSSYATLVPPGDRLLTVCFTEKDGVLQTLDAKSLESTSLEAPKGLSVPKGSGQGWLLTSPDVPGKVGIIRIVPRNRSIEGELVLVDLDGGRRTEMPLPGPSPTGALAKRGGRELAVIWTADHHVYEIDLATKKMRRVTTKPFAPSPFSREKRGPALRGAVFDDALFAVTRNGMWARVNPATGTVRTGTLPIPAVGKERYVVDVRYSAAARLYAVAVLGPGDEGNSPQTIYFLDERLAVTRKLRLPTSLWDMELSPDGTQMFVLFTNGITGLYAAPSGKELARSKEPISSSVIFAAQ